MTQRAEPPPGYWTPVESPYMEAWHTAAAFPADSNPGCGYLYLIEFSTGVIKVGKSVQPRVRIRAQIHAAAPYGVHVVNMWLSNERPDYGLMEMELLAAMRGRWFTLAGHDYFSGPSFDDAVRLAQRVLQG